MNKVPYRKQPSRGVARRTIPALDDYLEDAWEDLGYRRIGIREAAIEFKQVTPKALKSSKRLG